MSEDDTSDTTGSIHGPSYDDSSSYLPDPPDSYHASDRRSEFAGGNQDVFNAGLARLFAASPPTVAEAALLAIPRWRLGTAPADFDSGRTQAQQERGKSSRREKARAAKNAARTPRAEPRILHVQPAIAGEGELAEVLLQAQSVRQCTALVFHVPKHGALPCLPHQFDRLGHLFAEQSENHRQQARLGPLVQATRQLDLDAIRGETYYIRSERPNLDREPGFQVIWVLMVPDAIYSHSCTGDALLHILAARDDYDGVTFNPKERNYSRWRDLLPEFRWGPNVAADLLAGRAAMQNQQNCPGLRADRLYELCRYWLPKGFARVTAKDKELALESMALIDRMLALIPAGTATLTRQHIGSADAASRLRQNPELFEKTWLREQRARAEKIAHTRWRVGFW